MDNYSCNLLNSVWIGEKVRDKQEWEKTIWGCVFILTVVTI